MGQKEPQTSPRCKKFSFTAVVFGRINAQKTSHSILYCIWIMHTSKHSLFFFSSKSKLHCKMKVTFRWAVLMKKANSTMPVTISTGITFTSDDYLITQGSLILQTAAVLGTAGPQSENIYRALVSEFLLTKLIFKLSFVKILMPQIVLCSSKWWIIC